MVDKTSSTKLTTPIQPKNLSFAISAVLAAPMSFAVAQDQSSDQGDAEDALLEEVLVTARKRTESLMDIPQSIQAIGETQIREAGLYGMDDYVRFIPSMSYVSTNPGIATIVFRGVADAANNFITEPAAALYLDEQSLTLNATPDPRLIDVARVEALSGPQGTLYGASAQAGTLRIITNKPDPEAFDAFVDATLKTGSDSDASYDLNAMVNIPLSDNLAIRLVGFTAEDGGFIDNVLGESRPYRVYTNDGQELDNFNDVEHKGGRISAKWFINDNWALTGGIINQQTYSKGRPEMDPTTGRDLAVVRFRPDREYDDNDWTQYALTIEGDLGFADFVSASSYFTRDWTYTQDTQVYASYFGTFCYDGYYGGLYSNYAPYCFQAEGVGNYYNDAIGYLQNVQKDKRFAQEFRLSGSSDRFDWVAGMYYEKAEQDWEFTTLETGVGYDNSKGYANWLAGRVGNIPTRSPDDTWWLSADSTDWSQYAFFGELTWRFTEKWDATIGGRWFDRQQDKVYFVELPRYNLSGDVLYLPKDDDGFIPKLSISYQATDNMMFYGLYSEGFRPGGLNRTRGVPFFPAEWESDLLENMEFGTKMTLADGRVRLTATYFNMKWKDYQLEVVDPSSKGCGTAGALPEPNCGQPWQKVVGNVGDATSRGLELQVDTALSANWGFGFNATWLDSTLDDGFDFSVPVPAGSRLPLAPEFKGATYLQYNRDVDWFGGAFNDAYARLQWTYTGDMLNQVEPFDQYTFDGGYADGDGPAGQFVQPSYDIGDFRIGMNGEAWGVSLFVNNLTDTRAVLFENPFEFDHFFGKGRQTINRPREYGIRVNYRFR